MPSPRDLAALLVAGFDRHAEVRLDRALIALLRSTGIERFRSEETAWKLEDSVLRLLREYQPENLPFRLCDGGKRLVGKARCSASDNPDIAFARRAEALATEVLDTLLELTPHDFEVVSAASMVLSGSREMRALCTGDEGGIDFYGRLPIRQPSSRIPEGILFTTLLPKDLLLLGQAKRYGRHARIGRPEIQQFKAQVLDCLNKYEDNQSPPTHRVPDSYYSRNEPCLGVFVTTASFAETADEYVEPSGIVLVPGMKLSQFLAFHRVGVVQDVDVLRFDQDKFAAWLAEQRRNLTEIGPAFKSGIC